MRRLGHKAILLGFSLPAVATAGLVAFFAMGEAPVTQVVTYQGSPSHVLAGEGRVGVPQRVESFDISSAEPTPPYPPLKAGEGDGKLALLPSGEGAPEGRMRALPEPQSETVALAERPSSALRAPSPDGGREIASAAQITIRPGNSLWAISRELYGAGRHYLTLLDANKDKINDPKLIYPGQVLAAPKKMEN